MAGRKLNQKKYFTQKVYKMAKTTLIKKETRGGPGRNQGRKSPFKEETKGVKFTCPVSKVEELKNAVKKIFEKWVREGV